MSKSSSSARKRASARRSTVKSTPPASNKHRKRPLGLLAQFQQLSVFGQVAMVAMVLLTMLGLWWMATDPQAISLPFGQSAVEVGPSELEFEIIELEPSTQLEVTTTVTPQPTPRPVVATPRPTAVPTTVSTAAPTNNASCLQTAVTQCRQEVGYSGKCEQKDRMLDCVKSKGCPQTFSIGACI